MLENTKVSRQKNTTSQAYKLCQGDRENVMSRDNFKAQLKKNGHPRKNNEKWRCIYMFDSNTNEWKISRQEGDDPVKDPEVNNLYINFGVVWDFFKQVFHSNSYNDKGASLIGKIRENHDCAEWVPQGPGYFEFGKPNRPEIGSLTQDVSIVGHEFFHAVLWSRVEKMLGARGAEGAIRESYCDIFGVLAEQWYSVAEVSQACWLLGKSIIKPEDLCIGYRSLKSPGWAHKYDKQLDRLSGEISKKANPYRYSGIPNRAFYLFCSLSNEKYAWGRCARVWYDALEVMKEYDQTNTISFDFPTFGKMLVKTASKLQYDELIGPLREAWRQVGVSVPRPT